MPWRESQEDTKNIWPLKYQLELQVFNYHMTFTFCRRPVILLDGKNDFADVTEVINQLTLKIEDCPRLSEWAQRNHLSP